MQVPYLWISGNINKTGFLILLNNMESNIQFKKTKTIICTFIILCCFSFLGGCVINKRNHMVTTVNNGILQ